MRSFSCVPLFFCNNLTQKRKQKQIEEERARLKKKEEDARIVREKYAREKAEKIAQKHGTAQPAAVASAAAVPATQPKANPNAAAATGAATIQVRVPNQSPVVVSDLKGDSTLQELYARVDALSHGVSASCVLTVPFPPPPKHLFRDDTTICHQTLHQLGLTPRAALVLTELASLGKVAQGRGEMPNANPGGGGGMMPPFMPGMPGMGRGRGRGVGFGGGGGGGGGQGHHLGGGAGGVEPPPAADGIDISRTVESRYLKKAGVDQECRICQGPLNDGDTIRTLPCMHVFHGECLEEWAEGNSHCPDCE